MVWRWVLQAVRPKFWIKHSTNFKNFKNKNRISVCISIVATVHHNLDLVQNLNFYGNIRRSIQYSYENRLFCKQQLVLEDTIQKTSYLPLGEREKQGTGELHGGAALTEESGKEKSCTSVISPYFHCYVLPSLRTKSDHRGPSFSVSSVWPPFGEALRNLSWVTFPGCIH